MRGNAHVWGRMVLAAAVAASCQAEVGVERSADAVITADAGPNVGRTSVVFRQMFRTGGDLKALAVGPGDDIWIAGTFESSLALGPTELTSAGQRDVFVARLDPQGNPRWARSVGGPEYERCSGVAVDAEGNAIVAYWFSDERGHPVTTLSKLGATGDITWQKLLRSIPGEGPPGIFDAAADRRGGILLAGGADSTIVARVDANGDTLWVNHRGYSDYARIRLAVDGHGNAIVGEGSTVNSSIRLMKVSPSGEMLIKERFKGSAEAVNFHSVGADPQGNILLSGFGGVDFSAHSGRSRYPPDPWMAKLSPGGGKIWQIFGVTGRMAADGAGNVLCAGTDFVGKLDPSGHWLWKQPVHLDGPERGYGNVAALAADSAGRVLLAGAFKGSADFGDDPLESGERGALFVAALAP